MSGFMETIVNLVLSTYKWLICWEILYDFQGGVILRLGKFHRLAKKGWNWRLPLGIEEVWTTNVVPTSVDLPPQAVVTTDGCTVLVEVVILWGVTNVRKYILEVESASTVLTEAGAASVYDIVSKHTWKELQEAAINTELTDEIRYRGKKWGVKVISVQITSLSKLSLRDGCFRIANPVSLVGAG